MFLILKQEWTIYNLDFSLNQTPFAFLTKVWKFILQTRLSRTIVTFIFQYYKSFLVYTVQLYCTGSRYNQIIWSLDRLEYCWWHRFHVSKSSWPCQLEWPIYYVLRERGYFSRNLSQGVSSCEETNFPAFGRLYKEFCFWYHLSKSPRRNKFYYMIM